MNEIEDRINDKLEEVEKYLEEIREYLPESYEKYCNNSLKKLACERLFEKIVEAIVSITFLIIRERKLGNPEDDESAFDMLSNAGIISSSLSIKLKAAKSMRNFIIHEYGDVDDLKVYTSISEEIEPDIREFNQAMRKVI